MRVVGCGRLIFQDGKLFRLEGQLREGMIVVICTGMACTSVGDELRCETHPPILSRDGEDDKAVNNNSAGPP